MPNSELHDTDFAHIRGLYGYLNVPPLSLQEETFLLNHMRGQSLHAAAKAVGMTPSRAQALLTSPSAMKVHEYFRYEMLKNARFDVDTATQMYLEAHRKAVSATEEIKATDSLAKLHMLGGFAPVQVIVREHERNAEKEIGPRSAKQLERMSEESLLELAAFGGLDSLDPEPLDYDDDTVIEGEVASG